MCIRDRFCIDIKSCHCYFRVCKSDEIWNKKAFFPYILIFLLYKTNRFHVAVRLFSKRSQRTSKCGKNISDTFRCASYATFLFLPHVDVICDLILNRPMATWTDAQQHGINLLNTSLFPFPTTMQLQSFDKQRSHFTYLQVQYNMELMEEASFPATFSIMAKKTLC